MYLFTYLVYKDFVRVVYIYIDIGYNVINSYLFYLDINIIFVKCNIYLRRIFSICIYLVWGPQVKTALVNTCGYIRNF